MAINLDVEFYCSDCDEFEPDIEKEEINLSGNLWDYKIIHNTFIKCQHRNRCKAIHDKAVQKFKEMNENDN